MEEHQLADRRLVCHLEGVVDGAMAPVGPLGELLRGELGVVDQEVHPVDEFQDRLVDMPGVVDGLLVVADVGDAHPTPVDPVAEGGPDVGNLTDRHPGRPHVERTRRGVMEGDLTRHVVDTDREEGRVHERVEGGLQRPARLDRAVDVQSGTLTVQRREEGQALDVVPVQVAEQCRAAEGHLGTGFGHAVEAQSRSEVQQDRLPTGYVDDHAGGVASIPTVLIARAGGRTSHAVEGDVQRIAHRRKRVGAPSVADAGL